MLIFAFNCSLFGRIAALDRRGLLLQTEERGGLSVGLSVCLSRSRALPETAEPIEMPFGM